MKGDVGLKEECDRLVAEAVGAFGRLDVLVNNAAVFEGGPIGEIAEKVLERIFRVNVFAAIHLVQAALPHLEKAKGCVINISSSTSIFGKKGAIPYSSTKGAINVFTRSLAVELAERGGTRWCRGRSGRRPSPPRTRRRCGSSAPSPW